MAFWSAVLGLGRKIPNPKGSVTITNVSVTESRKGAKKGNDGGPAEVRIKTKDNMMITMCGFLPSTGVRNASVNLTLTAEEAGRLSYAGSPSWEVHLIGRTENVGAQAVVSTPKVEKKATAPSQQPAVASAKSSKTDLSKMSVGKPRIQDLLDMEADEDESEEEGESSEGEDPGEAAILKSVKAKIKNIGNLSVSTPNGKRFVNDDDDDEDEEDSDLGGFIVNDDEEDVEDEEGSTEEDDDEEEEIQIQPKAKVPKMDASLNRKSATPLTLTPAKSPALANVPTPQRSLPTKKVITKNGVVIQEVKSGNGPIAKRGKNVTVFYTGRLKSNNKKFDSNTSGRGFTFRLGAKQVIAGWDIGVEGMKVGEHRKIQIPAKLGYGKNGAPPDIPPNSDLLFDIELRHVK